MANVDEAYCSEADLRTGDLRAPSYTSKEQYIKGAAKEIESALGHIYVTPFVIDPSVPENRPSILLIEKLNWLLASGRFILDVAAAGERDNLHAYGASMLKEAQDILKQLQNREPLLTGAPLIPGTGDQGGSGPRIDNEDSESLVKGFYEQNRSPYLGAGEPLPGWPYKKPVIPYG